MLISFIFLIAAFLYISIGDTIKFHWNISVYNEMKDSSFKDWLNPNSYIWMYKNGDPNQGEAFWGSSRWFSFLIDGWHCLKMLYLLSFIFALTLNDFYIPFINKWIDSLIIYIVYGLIFELLYGYILVVKKQKTN